MTKLEQFPEASACRLLVTRLYEYLGAIGPAVSKLFSILERKYKSDCNGNNTVTVHGNNIDIYRRISQVEVYNGLDTKSIQLDSLAHILYPSLIPLGAYNRADKQARQMEAFYRTNEREVSSKLRCY